MARSVKGGGGGSGIAGRLMERAVENPAASGGLLVMALTAGAIVINATYLQPADHPRPHLAPRAPSAASSAPPAVPTPRPSPVQAAALPPVTAPATTSARPAAPPVVVSVPVRLTPEAEAAMITDVQRELAKRNLYAGTVDGISGSRTKAAIAAYQTSAGLPATGLATPELLTQLRQPATPKPATPAVMPSNSDPKYHSGFK